MLFGGTTKLSNVTADCFVLDTSSWTWSNVNGGAGYSDPVGLERSLGPGACTWHSAAFGKLSSDTPGHLPVGTESPLSLASHTGSVSGGVEDDEAAPEEGKDVKDGDGEGTASPTPVAAPPRRKLWNATDMDEAEGASRSVVLFFGGVQAFNTPAPFAWALDRKGCWAACVPFSSSSSSVGEGKGMDEEEGKEDARQEPGSRFGSVWVAMEDGESIFCCGGSEHGGTARADAYMLNLWAPTPPPPPVVDNTPKPVVVSFPDGSYDGFLDDQGRRSGPGTFSYKNGDVFEGDWVENVRHGKGTCRFANGDVYEGQWKVDEAQGKGKFTTSPASAPLDGSRYTVSYEGSFSKGERSGQGSVTLSDGSVMKGSFKDGDLVGNKGTMVSPEGAKVAGLWKGDLLVSGTETTPQGDVYTGPFDRRGKRHGIGKCDYADGSDYEGEWRNGKRNGHGIFKCARTRETYEGKWIGDQRAGRGVCNYSAGHRYEGLWASDKRHGLCPCPLPAPALLSRVSPPNP